MTRFSTYDPHDAEWESPDTGRTVYRPGADDDYCEICDRDVVNGLCGCNCESTTEGPIGVAGFLSGRYR